MLLDNTEEKRIMTVEHLNACSCERDSEDVIMKKSYKIEVDCANCAQKMEDAAKKTDGVKDAVVNFMTLKMTVVFDEGANEKETMERVLKNCRKVESDCEIDF